MQKWMYYWGEGGKGIPAELDVTYWSGTGMDSRLVGRLFCSSEYASSELVDWIVRLAFSFTFAKNSLTLRPGGRIMALS